MSSNMTGKIQFMTISPDERSYKSFNEDPSDDELLKNHPYPLAFTIEDLIFPSNSPRSKAKRKKQLKPPRPQNAWVLFLKNFIKLHQLEGKDNSSLASDAWNRQPPIVHKFFKLLEKKAKDKHNEDYPDYIFAPDRSKKIEKSRRKKNQIIQFEFPDQFSKILENKAKDKQNAKPHCNKNRNIQFESHESHNEVTMPKNALNVNSNNINFSVIDFSHYVEHPNDDHELISNSFFQQKIPDQIQTLNQDLFNQDLFSLYINVDMLDS
ncbi:hypothetical protein C2G38_2168630 [Gigaspora rosea]|uniref:HMG box domain-containing protein n=1 Tax=Gigaspora rosea TaxID=44941 RepID=A0A397VWS0_9GLOM|nr:hypothetical protein C2G38_2168630 [Gigaspora rosea]CAG8444767.1 22227_t:CDS:1 [Gigaspora rosea]